MINKKTLSALISQEVDFVDLKFTDLRGVWQHMTVPVGEFSDENLEKGFGFDGSSIRGFSTIFESDMLLKPDISTVFVDPFFERTLSCTCDVFDPETLAPFEKDPRYTARKAEEYLKKTKVGDMSYWGPEIEFFVFDKLSVGLDPYSSYINIKQRELSSGNFEDDKNFDYKIRNKLGYFPTPPFDTLQSFRSEMVKILEDIGISIEVHHHEVASGGQLEIDMRYDSLVAMADKVMIYKYVARNLAAKYNMTACFLPKPIYGDNGSGMHTHQSIFKAGKNLFFDPTGKESYAELSKLGLSYSAGLLSNIGTLLALTNPTLNSYRRLVPHFEAPTAIAFSKRNRSAAIRIPMYYKNEEKAKRIEFRVPDPSCNPYLSFSAQLVFGLEGVEKNRDPRKLGYGPFEQNVWELNKVEQAPNNFFEIMDNLASDKILIKSEVFAKSQIESYIEVKKQEATQTLLYPTPSDFWFYGDI